MGRPDQCASTALTRQGDHSDDPALRKGILRSLTGAVQAAPSTADVQWIFLSRVMIASPAVVTCGIQIVVGVLILDDARRQT